MGIDVRRVRADEWERVRDLRLEALSDPDAALAFLHTREEEAAYPESLWRARAIDGASEEWAAQFVAVGAGGSPDRPDEDWVGSVSVVVHGEGEPNDPRASGPRRAVVVGVYVRPACRGVGLIDRLLDAASEWAASEGFAELLLNVHRDNARARRAYVRCGFRETGHSFHAVIGPEIEMSKAL